MNERKLNSMDMEDVARHYRAMLNCGVANGEAAATLVAGMYIAEAIERAAERLERNRRPEQRPERG